MNISDILITVAKVIGIGFLFLLLIALCFVFALYAVVTLVTCALIVICALILGVPLSIKGVSTKVMDMYNAIKGSVT